MLCPLALRSQDLIQLLVNTQPPPLGLSQCVNERMRFREGDEMK